MTRDDIIRMARVAGCHDNGEEFRFVELRYLERFAALVAAAERDKYEAKFKQLEAIMKEREQQPNKPCCLAERESCAKVCELMEQQAEGTECCKWPTPIDCAAAIRARSNT